MRKIALLAVIAAVAALGVTSVASGIQGGQGISVKLKSSKAGTAKKPRNIKLLTVVTTTTPTAAETGRFATRTATIFFDKNLVFNGRKFKSCTLSQVRADATRCPKGSKVGTGSTTALFSGTTLDLTVTAYNGPGGKGLSLVVRPATGSGVGGVLSGVLKNAGGGYGKKLVVTIDSSLQNPLGLPNTFATLTNFTTKVGGVSKGVPYIGLKGCTGGKVKIKGVFAYTDGTSKTATNTTRCTK